MRNTSISIVMTAAVALTLSAAAVAQDLPTGEAVIAKYIEAAGGKEAMNSVKTITMTGVFRMPGMGIEGKVTSYKAEGGKSVSETVLSNMGTFKNGTIDGIAWDVNPMAGNRILEGEEKANRLRSGEIEFILRWRDFFKEAKCVGEVTVEGAACYKVEMIPEEGSPAVYIFDKDSGLLTQIEEPTPMGTQVLKFQDYKKVNDLSMAHKLVIDIGQGDMEIVTESIEINGEIPEGVFDLPNSIKALR